MENQHLKNNYVSVIIPESRYSLLNSIDFLDHDKNNVQAGSFLKWVFASGKSQFSKRRQNISSSLIG